MPPRSARKTNTKMTKIQEATREELFGYMRRVLEAGLWLVEHGYGQAIVLPYQYATGHWRCEFHPAGKPSRPFFRYSEGQGHRYLANHCGGTVSRNISAEKLAQAIMVSVSEDVKHACSGQTSEDLLRWASQVRDALAAGLLPSAFGEYYGGAGEPWRLLPLAEHPEGQLSPMPGYIHPGHEPSQLLASPWREGQRQLRNCMRPGALILAPTIASDPEALHDVATKLAYALSCSEPLTQGPLLAAAIGALQTRTVGTSPLPLSGQPGRISTAAAEDPVIRRGTRLLGMVHELHKAGYQLLRIVSCWTDKGTWRIRLVQAPDVADDGWSPLLTTNDAHEYDSGDGTAWFGWQDAHKDDARSLAVKFLDRFPETAKACVGEDWAYAGWFARVLGRAECGELPVFFGLKANITEDLEPPPPMNCDSKRGERSPTGIPLISSRSMGPDDLPQPGAEYEDLWPFCLSYDGYHDGLQSIDACLAITDVVARSRDSTAVSPDQLRTAAFVLQRRLKNQAELEPVHRDHPDMRLLHDIVEKLRARFSQWPRP